MLSFIQRYLFDENMRSNINTTPEPLEVVPINVLNKLDKKSKFKHFGNISYIYKGVYNQKPVGIKVVPKSVKEKMTNDITSLKFIGALGALVNPNVTQVFNSLVRTIEKEMDVHRDYKYCLCINRKLDLSKYKIRTVAPVKELCTKTCFTYYYDNTGPFVETLSKCSQETINRVCSRLVLFFFESMYGSAHILFGDMNKHNLLYDNNNDTITILDYGCVHTLTKKMQKYLKELHTSLPTLKKTQCVVKKWGGTSTLANFMFKQAEPFFVKKTFAHVPTLASLSLDVNVTLLKIPSDLIIPVRACNQLVSILRSLNATIDIQEKLNKLFHA